MVRQSPATPYGSYNALHATNKWGRVHFFRK